MTKMEDTTKTQPAWMTPEVEAWIDEEGRKNPNQPIFVPPGEFLHEKWTIPEMVNTTMGLMPSAGLLVRRSVSDDENETAYQIAFFLVNEERWPIAPQGAEAVVHIHQSVQVCAKRTPATSEVICASEPEATPATT